MLNYKKQKTDKQNYSDIRFGDIMCNVNKPLRTITGLSRFWISVDELLDKNSLLQCGSWSLDYDFLNQDYQYVLGMSVPPLAMYRISKEIQTQWLDKLKDNK